MRASLLGLGFCFLIAFISPFLKTYTGLGNALLALLLGTCCNPIFERYRPSLNKGIDLAKEMCLSIAIVLLGFSINAADFLVYWKEILFFLPIIPIVIFVTVSIGSFFSVEKEEALLIGIGNAICGSAAIAATAPLLGATEKDIGRSLATINILGVLLLFLFPLLIEAPIFHDIHHAYVLGGTLQAVGHVGALGAILSEEQATEALAFKMCRVAMLYPLCLYIMRMYKPKEVQNTKGIPWYVTGFAFAMLCSTFGHSYIPSELSEIGKFLLCVAMAGIGMRINFPSLLKGARKPLLVGMLSCAFMLICTMSISLLFS